MKQQYTAVNRFPAFADTYTIHANADDAWAWYWQKNPYATSESPRGTGWRLQQPSDAITDVSE